MIRIKPTQISKNKLSRKNSLVAKEHILIVNKHALKTYTNCESFSFSVNTNLYQRCFSIMFFVDYLCINPLNMTYNKEHFTELCNYHIHTHLFKITAYRPPPPFFWYTPICENILEFSHNTFKLLAYFVYVGFILVNAPPPHPGIPMVVNEKWFYLFRCYMKIKCLHLYNYVVTLIKRSLIHERSRLISIK